MLKRFTSEWRSFAAAACCCNTGHSPNKNYKNRRILHYFELISNVEIVSLAPQLQNCCRLVRTSTLFNENGTNKTILSQTNVGIVYNTLTLHNWCCRLVRTSTFLDVFIFCPVLQPRIGGKKCLSEISSRANSLKRLNCFGEI